MSKVIVITGAGSGLGRAIAERFGRDGETVVLLARSADKIEALARKIGANASAVGCDVTSPDSVRSAFAEIRERFGEIDVLINNAGIYPHSPIAEASDALVLSVIGTNLIGPIYCSREAIGMLRRGGLIINVSSESIGSHMPFSGLYRASKAGLEELSVALARELSAQEIRVTTVRAGAMRGDDGYPEMDMEMGRRVIEAAMAAGIDVMKLPLTHFNAAAEAFRGIVDLPPDLHVPSIVLGAVKPVEGGHNAAA